MCTIYRTLRGLGEGVKGTSETCLGMADADLVPCSPSCDIWSVAVEQGWHHLPPLPLVLGGLVLVRLGWW